VNGAEVGTGLGDPAAHRACARSRPSR